MELKDIYLVMQEIGGHAAMKVFIERPALLKGVIITDTIPFPCSAYPKIVKMWNMVNGRAFGFLNSNFNFLIRTMTRFGFRKRKLSKQERNVYKQMFHTKTRRRNITRLLHELVVEEKLLLEIQKHFETTFNPKPALLIYGDKDPLTRQGVPQRAFEMLPNAELHWINGEAHFPHEGAPEDMSLVISNWLGKISFTP